MTIYEEMIHSQGACNAVGLLNAASRIAEAIQEDMKTGKWQGLRNHHPFIRLLAEQLMHLSQKTEWAEAYYWCLDRDREATAARTKAA